MRVSQIKNVTPHTSTHNAIIAPRQKTHKAHLKGTTKERLTLKLNTSPTQFSQSAHNAKLILQFRTGLGRVWVSLGSGWTGYWLLHPHALPCARPSRGTNSFLKTQRRTPPPGYKYHTNEYRGSTGQTMVQKQD